MSCKSLSDGGADSQISLAEAQWRPASRRVAVLYGLQVAGFGWLALQLANALGMQQITGTRRSVLPRPVDGPGGGSLSVALHITDCLSRGSPALATALIVTA